MSKQFSALGVSAPILKALSELNIVEPTKFNKKQFRYFYPKVMML
jgi:ATP-dependent RNA helicase DeaD